MTEGLQQVSMTVADAARVLGVTPRAIRDYIRKGVLPAMKVGTKPLVLKEEIDRLIAEARERADAASV
jgi:excisionase family DNA binding protein